MIGSKRYWSFLCSATDHSYVNSLYKYFIIIIIIIIVIIIIIIIIIILTLRHWNVLLITCQGVSKQFPALSKT